MTLEPAYDQAEMIANEANARGSFSPGQAEWIEAFYRNVQSRMLNLYDGARLNAWRIYEREKLAAYWKESMGNEHVAFAVRRWCRRRLLGSRR